MTKSKAKDELAKKLRALHQQKPSPAELAAEKTAWLSAVEALFKEVSSWLAEFKGLLVIDNVSKQVWEDRFGMYECPMLRIVAGNGRKVTLEPVGRFVVGASGRVDVISGSSRTMLLLNEAHWEMLVDRGPPLKRVELTQELFYKLLNDLVG